MNKELLNASYQLRSMMVGLTGTMIHDLKVKDLSVLNSRERENLMEAFVLSLGDDDPQRSLSSTEYHPLPLFDRGPFGREVFPLEHWRKLGRASEFWPSHAKEAARRLGLHSGKLPKWSQIRDFFRDRGFEPIPVKGYVGHPIYSYLISKRRIPVTTSWIFRYTHAPYYCNPADTLHEIGHGLALTDPVYADLFVRFAAAANEFRGRIPYERTNVYYGRFFEYAYVPQSDGKVDPIGALAFVLETSRLERDGLFPAVRETENIFKQKTRYRPFHSREEWQESIENFIETKLRNPKRVRV